MDKYTKDESVPEYEVPFVQQQKINRSRPLYAQVIVAFVVYLTAICLGLSTGYSAILLPQLRVNDSVIQINEDIESWIVSIYIGTNSAGCLLSGFAMHMWGRKLTNQISVVCLCAGWILIAVSKSFPIMLLGRALGGFGKGLSTPAFTFYLEEMADPRLRGTLSACILFTYSIGIMLISMLGTTVSWTISAGLGAVLSFLNLIGYSMLPESPVWLVRNNRIDQAHSVFKWLWGSGHDAQVEGDLQELMKRIKDESSEANKEKDSSLNWKQYLKPHILKPFFTIHIFNILQIVCGTNLFIFYAMDIISGMNVHGNLDVNLINVLTSSIRVVFMGVSCLVLVWIGRRTLSISSGVGSGTAAVILGTLICFKVTHEWLVISLIMLYVAFNTYGYFVLPPSMIGEMLPSKIRCIAGAYIFTLNDIGMFGATKAFPSIAASVGAHGLFWIFGISSLVCALFLYLLLPETMGRSLVDIERYFLQSNILWVTRNKNKVKMNSLV